MDPIGANATLLIVDVQQGFDDPAWGRRNNPVMEDRVADLLRAWRARHHRVVFARHCSVEPSSPLRRGQSGNALKPVVDRRHDEPVIDKTRNSCFIGTSLEAELREQHCELLVIAGLTTNHCVSTTARMAGNLGFRTWVVSDATAAFDRTGPDHVTYPAELVHAMALADLHREFAEVVDTDHVVAAVGASR